MKMFGEMEFWFAMIKIVAIVSIVVGLAASDALSVTDRCRKRHSRICGMTAAWFPKGLSGFFAGFQIAVFAFVGIELVGTTAAETKDPEKSLPRAINSIPIRIIMFYVFALIVIMSVTPWSSVVPEKSPFVELFVLVGLPAAASVTNFVVLTSAASSATARCLLYHVCCLVWRRKVWHRKRSPVLSKRAVPAKGLTFSCICLLGGVVMLYVNPSAIGAFTMIQPFPRFCLCSSGRLSFARTWCTANSPYLHDKSIHKMPLGKSDVLRVWHSLCSWSCC